jgi:hypothetical protein
MKHEGMVHALEEIKGFLRPGASLIDMHPVREAPIIEVRMGDEAFFAEPSASYDYDDDLRHADDALTWALDRDLFVLDRVTSSTSSRSATRRGARATLPSTKARVREVALGSGRTAARGDLRSLAARIVVNTWSRSRWNQAVFDGTPVTLN